MIKFPRKEDSSMSSSDSSSMFVKKRTQKVMHKLILSQEALGIDEISAAVKIDLKALQREIQLQIKKQK